MKKRFRVITVDMITGIYEVDGETEKEAIELVRKARAIGMGGYYFVSDEIEHMPSTATEIEAGDER